MATARHLIPASVGRSQSPMRTSCLGSRVSSATSSAPFSIPVQPFPWTVLTSWPGRTPAKTRGICSSRRSRTTEQSRGFLKRGDRLIPRYRGEVVKEPLERVAGLDVIEQRLHGDAGPTKYRSPPENPGVTVDDGRACRLLGSHRLHSTFATPKVGADLSSHPGGGATLCSEYLRVIHEMDRLAGQPIERFGRQL